MTREWWKQILEKPPDSEASIERRMSILREVRGPRDMNADAAALKMQGVKFTSEPAAMPNQFGHRTAYVEAPGGIRIQDVDNVMVTYARCCQPVPGDRVVGIVTGIQGKRTFRVSVRGEEAHAGTTPHGERRDAPPAGMIRLREE